MSSHGVALGSEGVREPFVRRRIDRRVRPYLVLAIAGGAILWIMPKWTVDDAYIYFRYARNLALHGRLVWNLSGHPVEGYTGALFPLLLAPLLRIGLSATVASKLLGISSFVGAAILLDKILRRIASPAAVRWGCLSTFVLAPYLYVHALSGLETLVFATALLFAFDRMIELGERSGWRSFSVALLLLGLTRPEGVLYSLALLSAATLTRSSGSRRIWLSRAMNVAGFFLAPAIVYFIWRWSYYGYLLPNTYYAKAAHGFVWINELLLARWWATYVLIPVLAGVHVIPHLLQTQVRDRRGSTLLFIDMVAVASGVFLLLQRWPSRDAYNLQLTVVSIAAAALAMSLRSRGRSWRLDPVRTGFVALLAASAIIVFDYLRTNLIMTYSYRFYAHLFPLALIGIALSWRSAPALERHSRRTPILAVAALAAIAVGVVTLDQVRVERRFTTLYRDSLNDEHIAAGRLLDRIVDRDGRIGVVADAGAIPYYADRTAVDFGGLNDEYVAHHRAIEDVVSYFFASDVKAVVFTSLERDRLVPQLDIAPAARAITDDPRFARYRLYRSFTTPLQPYTEMLYLRDDVRP